MSSGLGAGSDGRIMSWSSGLCLVLWFLIFRLLRLCFEVIGLQVASGVSGFSVSVLGFRRFDGSDFGCRGL